MTSSLLSCAPPNVLSHLARHIWFVETEFGADSSVDRMSTQRVERTLNRSELDTTCPDIKSSLPIGDKR